MNSPAITTDSLRSAATTPRTSAEPPVLEVRDLRVSYGKVEAVKGISFSVVSGEFLTLLGPSGCGKTTTLRCIAGLESPSSGSISIDGREVATPSRQQSPDKRGINMVFQSYAVWPHLTVEQNVGYGLHAQKIPKAEIERRTHEALGLVGLEKFAKRYGTELSGGQQQRVAVARAVVTNPKIILLDEPLSNLDAGLRERMRDELLTLQRRIGRTAIYVTHDQGEAMAMSDRIILMNEGAIEQIAPPRELYRAPRTMFAAGFVGTTNVLRGRVVTDAQGSVFHAADSPLRLVVDHAPASGSDRCVVVFRPEHVQVGEHVQTQDNRLEGQVTSVAFLGSRCDVTVTVEGMAIRIEASAEFNAPIGSAVQIGLPPAALLCLPDVDAAAQNG